MGGSFSGGCRSEQWRSSLVLWRPEDEEIGSRMYICLTSGEGHQAFVARCERGMADVRVGLDILRGSKIRILARNNLVPFPSPHAH